MQEKVNFKVEKVEIESSRMDMSDVQSGCWGDSGSDWANNC